jgi:hypothetical protein
MYIPCSTLTDKLQQPCKYTVAFAFLARCATGSIRKENYTNNVVADEDFINYEDNGI